MKKATFDLEVLKVQELGRNRNICPVNECKGDDTKPENLRVCNACVAGFGREVVAQAKKAKEYARQEANRLPKVTIVAVQAIARKVFFSDEFGVNANADAVAKTIADLHGLSFVPVSGVVRQAQEEVRFAIWRNKAFAVAIEAITERKPDGIEFNRHCFEASPLVCENSDINNYIIQRAFDTVEAERLPQWEVDASGDLAVTVEIIAGKEGQGSLMSRIPEKDKYFQGRRITDKMILSVCRQVESKLFRRQREQAFDFVKREVEKMYPTGSRIDVKAFAKKGLNFKGASISEGMKVAACHAVSEKRLQVTIRQSQAKVAAAQASGIELDWRDKLGAKMGDLPKMASVKR